MKKPKFLAMTLAAALFAGMLLEAPLMTVRAEETAGTQATVSSGNAGETLAAPTSLAWTSYEGRKWGVEYTLSNWDEIVEKEGVCVVTLYKDGTPKCSAWQYPYLKNVEPAIGPYEIWFDEDIMESGTYKFSVHEEILVSGKLLKSEEVFSPERVYTAPEQRLGTVQDVVWDTEQTGAFYLTPLAGDISHYMVKLYKVVDGNKTSIGGVGFDNVAENGVFNYRAQLTEDGRIKADYSDYIEENGAGVYCVTVQAFSSNIDTWANGYASDYSVTLDTRSKTETESEKIANAIEENKGDPEAAVEAVKEAVDPEELATQMQLSETVLEQISKLESEYASTKSITVDQSVTEEAEALGISSTGISVVGAGFNAEPNSKVTLTIDVPEKKVAVPGGYKDGTQLDITLEGGKSGTLNMPVTVTMPVPTGINLNKLVLWHYHGETRSRVVFKDNGDGTITFTVTSFSTFLFTEEIPQTSSGSTAQPGSSAGSTAVSNGTQTKPAAAAEEETEPVALTYVVKRGDNMFRIARRHGLTLAQLAAWNPQIKNPAKIYAGQVLIVGYTKVEPEAAETDAENAEYYVVKKGDSLFRIAAKHKLTLAELKQLNPELFRQKYIFAGQKVRVK